MNINIAVLGAGAIGSSIGADLTKSGYNVMLIDQWPAHVEVMNAQGLHVTIREKELHTTVQAFHLCEVCTVQPQLDIIFLAPKSYDTHWMVEFIKPYLKPDGVLVSTQNSLNEEWIAPIIGCERGIGCTLELGAEIFEPGRVKRNTDHATTKFALGELDGSQVVNLFRFHDNANLASGLDSIRFVDAVKGIGHILQSSYALDIGFQRLAAGAGPSTRDGISRFNDDCFQRFTLCLAVVSGNAVDNWR